MEKMSNDTKAREKIIILFSGGFDSTLLLEMAIKLDYDPVLITFRYDQIHLEEVAVGKKFAENRFNHIILEVVLGSSVLTGVDVKYDGVSEYHVPSRNLTFISLAASQAESLGISKIWYGANYADRENLFPDCYQEWVFKLNELLKINGSRPIKVEAPLLGMSKDTIIKLANSYGITKDKVYSGYGI